MRRSSRPREEAESRSRNGGRGSFGGSPTGQEAGGVEAAAPRAPAHEPLARRLLRLLRVPARDERVPVAEPLRPAVTAALGRTGELPLPVRHRCAGLARGA